MPTKSKLNFIRNERKRIEERCSSNISAKQQLNTLDDIFRLNGYPENSIEQTKRPQNPHRNPQPASTEWSFLRSLTSLHDSMTRSPTSLEKKTSQYALPTNSTCSDKPYPTPPLSANVLETNAPSLTRNCAYEEMQCTSSRVIPVINNILVAQHASSTTA